ncbi:hypothetical protein BV20DRAFT_940334 [Pilatotrama ljubarskyi]|nr:hypothetical protein BV20DRAFT_940334 [Pilatotrama ljubarskyi]
MDASAGKQYQDNLMAMCAAGNHDVSKKYGICGIICAVLLFPCGLICLLWVFSTFLWRPSTRLTAIARSSDVEKRCVRCGAKV